MIIIFLLFFIIGVAGFLYFKDSVSKNPSQKKSSSLIPQLQKTPYEELESALNKTITAKTLYLDYKTKVTTRIAMAQTGVTQTLNNNVDGYLTGSTDGKTAKAELRIYNEKTPDLTVNMSLITAENGDIYLKTAGTGTKWLKFSKEQYEKENEKSSTDASLYGFEILSTIFSENKALFKTIRKETVTKLEDEVVAGKSLARYKVEISTPEFIKSLEEDQEKTEKDKKDAESILKEAVINATYSVDKETNYITKLVIETKNLTQISTPESDELKITTTHDIELTADLSRFDLPTNITIPDVQDVIGGENNI